MTALLMLMLSFNIFGQHTIAGSFVPNEDYKNVILYKITPSELQYVTYAPVQKEGTFEIKLDSTFTKGMYKLVYAVPQEEYSFDIIYNAAEDIELNYNSEIGISYKKSIENKLLMSYTNDMSQITRDIGEMYRKKELDTLALMNAFKLQKEKQANFEKTAQGTIALHFIKANKPYIPNRFEQFNTYISNLKLHFFDAVDFNDKTLQSSNFLIERTLNYVFGMTSVTNNEAKAYKMNIDDVYKAMSKADTVVKGNILEVLWQQMADTNYDEVANYISKTYLTDIAKKLNKFELLDRLQMFENLSIGSNAPDFYLEIKEGDKGLAKKLSQLNTAEKYVILFWSSTCSHCTKEVPLLENYIKTHKNYKIQVIAVGLEDESQHWLSEISKYPDFIHVLGLNKWENTIGNSYNVTATPSYFVLDKDKKIIAKPYDFDELKKFLDDSM